MKLFPRLKPNETVFGFIYYALQLLIIPAVLVLINWMLPKPFSEAQINFIFFALNFIAVTLIFRKYLVDNFKAALVLPWRTFRYAGLGLGIYFVGNMVFGFLITLVDPDFANINDMSIMVMVEENYALMTIGTVLLVPIAEECFYRGLIFRNLYEKSPVLAYLLSMVLFSLAHVMGYVTLVDWATLGLCFLQYLPASFALAWSYRRSGSLFTSILIHMTVNQIGMLAMR